MLFFAGRAGEAAAILRRAQERLPPGGAGRERLEVALLGVSYTSAPARREADSMIAALTRPGGPARSVLEATTLADPRHGRADVPAVVRDGGGPAHRALAAGLPPEPQRGEAWAIVALAVLAATDELDAALRGTDEMLARARESWARPRPWRRARPARVHRDAPRRTGEPPRPTRRPRWNWRLTCSAPSSWSSAVSSAVLAGLERDETPESLRRLIDGAGIRYDTEFSPAHSCATPRACCAPPRATPRARSRSCWPAARTIRRSAR